MPNSKNILNDLKKSDSCSEENRVDTKFFNCDKKFELLNGESLDGFTLSYETYGTLNKKKDNVILLFHALSGSHHAAGFNDQINGINFWQDDCKIGWWDDFIGSGKALDTDKFFIICANYLGGCYGSTGPSSFNKETGRCFGSDFPRVSAADIAKSQFELLNFLEIDKVHAVIGGSIGGLMALTFSVLYPERVDIVIPIASSLSISVLQRLTILEQIWAIENDVNFNDGNYYDQEKKPNNGLALARIISHKTFISLSTLAKRASTEVVHPSDIFSWYKIEDPLESYIVYQGQKFIPRFDANTYLRILEMWTNFDILKYTGLKSYDEVFSRCKKHKYLVFSIDSDVCFYPDDQSILVKTLKKSGIDTMHITVHSEKGHDSFLIEPELFSPHLSYVLNDGIN